MDPTVPMSPTPTLRPRSASRNAFNNSPSRTPSTLRKGSKPYSKSSSHRRSTSIAKRTDSGRREDDMPVEILITPAITRKAFHLFSQDIKGEVRAANPGARKYELLLLIDKEWQKIRETDVEKAYERRAIDARCEGDAVPVEIIITQAITKKAFQLFSQDIAADVHAVNPGIGKYQLLVLIEEQWQKIRETDVERAYERRAIDAIQAAKAASTERRQQRLVEAPGRVDPEEATAIAEQQQQRLNELLNKVNFGEWTVDDAFDINLTKADIDSLWTLPDEGWEGWVSDSKELAFDRWHFTWLKLRMDEETLKMCRKVLYEYCGPE